VETATPALIAFRKTEAVFFLLENWNRRHAS